MITLDYELSLGWDRRTTELKLRSADEMTLRYDCFLGDVVFVDGVDFSARWGWVPVLDFALHLWAIAGGLVSEAEELFEFTESDAAIEVSASGRHRQDQGRLRLDDGRGAPPRVLAPGPAIRRAGETDLTGGCPDLASNSFVVTLSRGHGATGGGATGQVQ